MSTEGLDIEFLDELIYGDKEFAEELFSTFSESSLVCLDQGEAAARSGQVEEAFRNFHTLKGAAGSVGLTALRDKARDFEMAARQGELQTCLDRLGELRVAVEQGRSLLGTYLTRLD